MIYVVAYDLTKPAEKPADYTKIIKEIETVYESAHLQESVWIVESDEKARDIRDKLKIHLPESANLFVAKLAGNWASHKLTQPYRPMA